MKCPKCGREMTDYRWPGFNPDEYVCPKCGHEEKVKTEKGKG